MSTARLYQAGTVTAVAGETALGGLMTAWLGTVRPGAIVFLEGQVRVVIDVESNTLLNVNEPWSADATGADYTMVLTLDVELGVRAYDKVNTLLALVQGDIPSIELRSTETDIQWRQADGGAWATLVGLGALIAPAISDLEDAIDAAAGAAVAAAATSASDASSSASTALAAASTAMTMATEAADAAAIATTAASAAASGAEDAASSATAAASSADIATTKASDAAASASSASSSASSATSRAGEAESFATTATTKAAEASSSAASAASSAAAAVTTVSNASITTDTLAQLDAFSASDGATGQVLDDGQRTGFYARQSGSWVLKSRTTVPALAAAVSPFFETLDPDHLMTFAASGAGGRTSILGHVSADGKLHWPEIEGNISGQLSSGDMAVYGYETLEPGDFFFLDAGGRIVSTYTQAALSTYELDTLEGAYAGVVIADAGGSIRGYVPSQPADELLTQVSLSKGSQVDLSTRLARMLDSYGNLRTPAWGLYRLRQTRMKLAKLRAGQAATLTINVYGDSNTYSPNWLDPFTRRLRADLGDAGGGYVQLRDPYNRPHCVVGEYTTVLSGTWVDVASTAPTPDLGYIKSSSAGAKVSFSGPSKDVLTGVSLFYLPTADGQARYRWNGGSWTSLDLTVGTGLGIASLSGIPSSGSWTLDVEVVAGECRLGGLLPVTAASGVRVNKLGQNGGAASQVASAGGNLSAWQSGAAALSPDLSIVMLATNDQVSRTPLQVATSFTTIAANLRAALPGQDVLAVVPPENHLGRSTSMFDIAAAVREAAVASKIPFLDLQPFFGDSIAEYGPSSAHNWMPDGVHYDSTYGGHAVADAVYRAITATL